MGFPRFEWFPRDSPANIKALDFDAVALGWQRLEGGGAVDRTQTITLSGKASTVVHGAYEVFRIEFQGFGPYKSAAHRTFFSQLWSWWEHAAAGGTFAFAFDSAKKAATTLTAPTAHNTTALAVASSAGFAHDDWLLLEDANDRTKRTRRALNAVDTGVQMTLYDEAGRIFSTGSVVRHAEYFPVCVCLDKESPFKERKAGEGVHLWDFESTIRTAR